MPISSRGAALIALTSGLLAAGATAAAMRRPEPAAAPASSRAHRVHEMGAAVMPFALDRTTHVFEMTVDGGIQDVVAKDAADTATIRLIRQHLGHEAARFGRGDFEDPMALHGAAMPGVQDLAAGADRLEVEYQPLPDGGRITYRTADPALVTAVHRWFGAQLSDHAADATYR